MKPMGGEYASKRFLPSVAYLPMRYPLISPPCLAAKGTRTTTVKSLISSRMDPARSRNRQMPGSLGAMMPLARGNSVMGSTLRVPYSGSQRYSTSPGPTPSTETGRFSRSSGFAVITRSMPELPNANFGR